MVDAKKMKKILRSNGYEYIRCKGSHFIYSNGTNTIAVNKDLNCMVARRLIKQYNLEYAKQEEKTMDWMDFNRDGEVDAAEMYLAEELICSSKEEHEALFGDAGDFEDDEYEEEDE